MDIRTGDFSSLVERLAIEGDYLPSVNTPNSYPPSTPIGGGGLGIGSLMVPVPGRAFFVQSATVATSALITGRLQTNLVSGVTGIGTFPYSDLGYMAGGVAGQARFELNLFLRSAYQFAGSSISAKISQFLDTTPTAVYTNVNFTGFTLADDLNFGADKTILILGDSRENGTGPTVVDLAPGKVITNFYRSRGIDARYILKAYSGSTTTGHETFRKRGVYDGFKKLDLIVYDLGTNNAAQALPTATGVSDMLAMIAWKRRFWPEAKMLILGSPPMQSNTFETAMAALRAAQASAVAGLNDPSILFFSFENAFDRTVGSNYFAADGADGTRIHPTDPGLTQMFNGGYSGFIGLLPWLAANLPAI